MLGDDFFSSPLPALDASRSRHHAEVIGYLRLLVVQIQHVMANIADGVMCREHASPNIRFKRILKDVNR
jgi:hypothetical protein